MQNKITSGTSATNLTPKNKVDVDVLKKRIFHKKNPTSCLSNWKKSRSKSSKDFEKAY